MEPCVSSSYPCHPCGYRQALCSVLRRMEAAEEKFNGADLAMVIGAWTDLRTVLEEEVRLYLAEGR